MNTEDAYFFSKVTASVDISQRSPTLHSSNFEASLTRLTGGDALAFLPAPNKKSMKRILFPALLFLLSIACPAQTEQELLTQLLEEEKNTVDALVLYPAETRSAILEASQFPEALIRLEAMQSKTSDTFKDLLANYPKETQEMIWDLTRYPGLVAAMAENGGKNAGEIEAIIDAYPHEIRDRARTARLDYFDLLVKIDQLNARWERAFESLVREYPGKTQDALRQLIELPEVLTLLTDDIRLTVLVGDIYRKNPRWLLEQLDSLSLVAARENARELEDWKANLEANPQAKEEFISSTSAFAEEYEYDDAYYDYGKDYDYEEHTFVEHHYYYHYPYWFGYPHWYLYPRWRPYPFWYDSGFYWGHGHVLIIVDLPSFYFCNWYFYYPNHHHYYPHLSSHFANHYYGHRTSSTTPVSSMRNWKNRNRDVVTDDWLERGRRNPDQFREYGKFEAEREKYNRSHPAKPLAPADFLDKNKGRYPTLSKDRELQRQQNEQIKREKTPPVKPRIEPPTKREPMQPPRKPEVTEPRPKPQIEPKTKPSEIPKVDKARDYHRDKWEKSQPPKRQETVKPKTQTAPPKPKVERQAPAPKKETNKKNNG